MKADSSSSIWLLAHALDSDLSLGDVTACALDLRYLTVFPAEVSSASREASPSAHRRSVCGRQRLEDVDDQFFSARGH